MLTIAQATSFSNELEKNGLYEDANYVENYILLASNTPIEKHAGLWDWVGGKLSGWAKRIFFKNFRQAYNLAQEIQSELDVHMEAIGEKYQETEMYLNRHDLTNWQKTIAELGVNITPSDRLANLQERYNDSVMEMNKGIGLLSDEQQEEFEKEKKKQAKKRKKKRKKEETRIERKRALKQKEKELKKKKKQKEMGDLPEEEETEVPVPKGGTPLSEINKEKTIDIGKPEIKEEEEEDALETVEEIVGIKDPDSLSPIQHRRVYGPYKAPSKQYQPWNGTDYFYDIGFGYDRIIIPDPVLGWNLKHSQFEVRQRDDGKWFLTVNQDRGLPREMKSTVAQKAYLDRSWVKEKEFEDDGGITWHEFASVDPEIIHMFEEDLITPKLPENVVRVEGTPNYDFYRDDSDGSIYVPKDQFDKVHSEDFFDDLYQTGTVVYGKLTDNANREWNHVLRRRSREGTYLMCNLAPEEVAEDTWVKINRVNRDVFEAGRAISIKPAPVAPTSEVEYEDLDMSGVEKITECPDCGRDNVTTDYEEGVWMCPDCGKVDNLTSEEPPRAPRVPGRRTERGGTTASRLDKIVALAMMT